MNAKKQPAPQIEKSKDSKKRKKAELAQKSTLKEKLKSPEKSNDNQLVSGKQTLRSLVVKFAEKERV